ncbi:PREDICTED: uncharacterized protein LOC108559998 [Nicrophorus vespilloides]|uniref:Uncharacterized protein LOC108559998 n=2 Tax=Nicrophorus vespilloides TaxID=110193 RepID=A0ABM1ME97_NICVS|nr:PREDICTED: uncharacterized protein LOC108559998 [Nicrophorus vespilloides]
MEDFKSEFDEALNKVVKISSMKIHDYSEYKEVLCRVAKARNNDFSDSKGRRLVKMYKVAIIDGESRLIPANNASTRIVCYVYMEEIYSILQESHIRLNHGDCQSMFNELKYKYVNITIDIIQLYLSFCKACLPKKNTAMKSFDEIMYQEMNSRCRLDIIDVKPHYDGDYKYIFSYEDYKTKYCFLRPLKSVCPNEVATIVVDIFTTIGAPNIIQTNRGSKFTYTLIQLLTEMWPYLRILPGMSTHDDNESIRNLIFKNHKGKKTFGDYRWTQVLGFIQIKKNRSFNADIQQTPFEAMFGRAVKIGLIDSVVSKKDIASLRTENDLRTVLCSYVNEKCTLLNKSSDDEIESPAKISQVATVEDEEGNNNKDDTKIEGIKNETQQQVKTRKSGYFIGNEVGSDKDSNKKTKRDAKEYDKIAKEVLNSPGQRGRRKKIKLQEIEIGKDIEAVFINEQPPVRISSHTVDDPLIVKRHTSSNLRNNRILNKGNDDRFYKKNYNLIKGIKDPVIVISEEQEMQKHINNIKMDHSYMRSSMDIDNAEEALDDSNISCIKTTEDIENFIFANTVDKGAAFKATNTVKSEVTKELKKPTKEEAFDLEYGGKKKDDRFEIQTAPDNFISCTTKVEFVPDRQSLEDNPNAEVIKKIKFKRIQTVTLNKQITKRVTRSSTRALNSNKPAEPSINLRVTKFDSKYRNKSKKSNKPDEKCKDLISLKKNKPNMEYTYAKRGKHVKKEIIEDVKPVLGEIESIVPDIDLKTFQSIQSLQHTITPNGNMAIPFDRNDDVDEDLCIYGHLIDPITGESTVEQYFVGCSCPTDCKNNKKCPCKLKSMLCNVKCHNAEECKN